MCNIYRPFSVFPWFAIGETALISIKMYFVNKSEVGKRLRI